jgi:trehalose 6-phosphate synthase/phosphatase
LQASHLVLELESELRAFDVRFVTLKGIVEIVPRRLNKGLIVKRILHDTAKKHGVDFILCFGDDISDEKMFSSVYTFISELVDDANIDPGPPVFDESGVVETVDANAMDSSRVLPEPLYAYTVAVGKKSTHACTFVNDAQEVANALVLLARGEIPEGGVPVWGREFSTDMFS